MFRGEKICSGERRSVQGREDLFRGEKICSREKKSVQGREDVFKGGRICSGARISVQGREDVFRGEKMCTGEMGYVMRREICLREGENPRGGGIRGSVVGDGLEFNPSYIDWTPRGSIKVYLWIERNLDKVPFMNSFSDRNINLTYPHSTPYLSSYYTLLVLIAHLTYPSITHLYLLIVHFLSITHLYLLIVHLTYPKHCTSLFTHSAPYIS